MKLKEKVQIALDEARMLIMGIQVLLGFDLEIFLMRRFGAFSVAGRELKLVGVALLLAATVLVLAPAAYHRIVEDGRDSLALHRFTRAALTIALVPFSITLGIEAFHVVYVVGGAVVGAIAGALVTSVALTAWFVFPRAQQKARRRYEEEPMEETSLDTKIRQALTEARVVLPGTQALLGFGLVAVFHDAFDALPLAARVIHLVGLGFLALSVVFLMLPAAYHRIAEQGDVSERLCVVASVSILGAMLTLALGLAAALFVVVEKAVSFGAGVATAAIWLATSLGVWFVLMYILRERQGDAHGKQRHFSTNAVSSGA